MRVGVFTDGLAHLGLEAALDWIEAELPGVHDLEVATGGFSPVPHAGLERLLADDDARDRWMASWEARGLRLAALNVSGNPLETPSHDVALHNTIRLAATLGVDRIVCMSGGRADLSGGAWFPGVEEAAARYWDERVLPYWEGIAELATAERASLRLCFELEPGSAAYNVSTVERLLAISAAFAVNLDPSHFLWQGIDALAAIERLAGRIGFAHGKDTVLDPDRVRFDGLLDRTTWRYATVGHGRPGSWWASFVSALVAAGYDDVISVEYEDAAVPAEVGVAESGRALEAAIAEAGA